MPYISKEDRWKLVQGRQGGELIDHPGQLNYLITMEVLGFLGPNPDYERFNAAVGALECAKMELYRRMVVPYEDGKIRENGDVYPRPIGNVGTLTPAVMDEMRRMWGSPEKDLA